MKTNWDLTHLYKSLNDWDNDYKQLKVIMEKLRSKIELINDSNSFCAFLSLKFEIEELIEKLYCYARRHVDIDKSQSKYINMSEDVLKIYYEEQKVNKNFEKLVIEQYDKVKAYMNTLDGNKYKRYLSLIIRRNNHLTSGKKAEECLKLEANNKLIKDKYHRLFGDKIIFNEVSIEGNYEVIDDISYSKYIKNDNQEIRKLVFQAYTDAYKNAKDEIKSLYIEKLSNDIKISQLEKYDSLLQKKLFETELKETTVSNLVKAVNANLSVMHNYNKYKKEMSKLNEFHVYDLYLTGPNNGSTTYLLTDGIEMIKNSLAVLGNDYLEVINKMFTEGWIDVYPSDNKRTMSFTSISYAGVPYVLVNYDGSINSIRTMSHEIGHAIHTYYSKNNNSFVNFEFSLFLTEIASKVNELLFNEYILNNVEDINTVKSVLSNIISSLGNSIFGQTMLTEFEDCIINKIANNYDLTTDDLNNIYLEINKKYNGDAVTYDDNVKYGWTKIPHYLAQETYYLYQYPIGTAIALNIARRIINKENGIINKYKQFLSSGNSISIKEALNIIDIDLDDDDYINNGIAYLNEKIMKLSSFK